MTMTHEQKHDLARRAVDVAWRQDEIDEVERQELRRWLAAAADALRLQGLGAHDRDLVEFLGDERDEQIARADRERAQVERLEQIVLAMKDERDAARSELCRLTHHKRGDGCSIPDCRNYRAAPDVTAAG